MISINGKVFSGNNVTIVNGRVIGDGGNAKLQKYDERKSEDCSNIEKIFVRSSIADVNVSVSNSQNVEAHLYGEVEIDRDVNLVVRVIDRELSISLKFAGSCFNGNLKLDILIPKKTFKVVSAITSSADVTIHEGVLTDHLYVKTQSGDLETNATVKKVSVITMSGDVELCIDAVENIGVDVCTMSGDVSAEFNNIANINLSTSSMSGNVKNHHKGSKGYTADVEITTMSGNIRIR